MEGTRLTALIDPRPIAERDRPGRAIREVDVNLVDRADGPRASACVRLAGLFRERVNVRGFDRPIPGDQAGFEDFIGRRNGK